MNLAPLKSALLAELADCKRPCDLAFFRQVLSFEPDNFGLNF